MPASSYGIKVSDSNADLAAAAKSGDAKALEDSAQAMMRDQYRQMVRGHAKDLPSYSVEMVSGMAGSLKDIVDSIPPTNTAEKAQHAQARTLLADAIKLAPSNLTAARDKFKAGSLLAIYVDANNVGSAQSTSQKKNNNSTTTSAPSYQTSNANSSNSKKTPLWKLFYLLGPGGTSTATAIAPAWAAEL